MIDMKAILQFCRLAGTARLEKVCVMTKGYTLFGNHYHAGPFVALTSPAHACYTSFTTGWNLPVSSIPLVINLSKVREGIVCAVPVNMVYLIVRKSSRYIKPRESMSKKPDIINSNGNVTIACSAPSGFPCESSVPPSDLALTSCVDCSPLLPRKHACGAVIGHSVLKFFLGYNLISHFVTSYNNVIRGWQLSLPFPKLYHTRVVAA